MNSVMREIRSTSLNYAIQETPFSTYITLRKSLNKAKIIEIHPENTMVSKSEDISNLLVHCELLEQANDALKKMFQG